VVREEVRVLKDVRVVEDTVVERDVTVVEVFSDTTLRHPLSRKL